MIKMFVIFIIGVFFLFISKKLNLREAIFDSYSSCYTNREYLGYAAMGCCSGTVGGTSSTGYLSEMCVGCPHFVDIKN